MLGVFGNVESKGAVRALVQEPVEAVKPSARTSLASAFSAIGAPTRMTLGDVLQHIRQRELLGKQLALRERELPQQVWPVNRELSRHHCRDHRNLRRFRSPSHWPMLATP